MKILTEFQRNPKEYKNKLDEYYCQMKDQILKYQHPITGLFPLNPNDKNCIISHVRDSVYCATAIWALHKCYKRIDDDEGRTYELGQCIVKCMRSILLGWMRQCQTLERFKMNQCPENSLHSIINYKTGELLKINYPHLQIDCVSLYLLQLTQMISSGLQIIYTKSEVAFVQNLVYYLERAYRIPDYGMWERGTKQNRNVTELHASSIGMAKAALEAVSGFNVFGSEGDHSTVLFVDIDAHSRNRIILTNLLPRESASKGSDSALLPALSWPAFGTHIIETRHETIERVQCRFQGRYGYKRFSRDGYKTVREGNSDRLYESGELKQYERIENEWPMFLAFMIIEYSFRQNYQKMDEYITQLNSLLVKVSGEKYKWLPKYYFVPFDYLEEEWQAPGSVIRKSSLSNNDPLHLMGQSLYLISQLLVSRCLLNHDIDPLTRHMAADERPSLIFGRHSSLMMHKNKPLNLVIQVVLISESVRLQQLLATYGIVCQTPRQVEPIQIWPPDQLTRVFKAMGCCKTMKLTGRPSRPVGQLGTSKFYRISGNTVLSYPLLFEIEDFYLMHDMNVVVDEVKSDFNFLANWWRLKGRPTFCFLIKEDMIKASDASVLIKFLASMKCGWIDGVRVLLGRAQNFVASGCVDHLDFLHSRNDILDNIVRLQELTASTSFHSLTDVSFSPNTSGYKLCEEHKVEFDRKSTEDLVNVLLNCESMIIQAQCLHVLLERHGRDHPIKWPEKETVIDRIVYLSRQSAIHQSWNTVRYCSAILGRTVNSLAPSISAILVNGKHLSIGVPKKSKEIIISNPIPPDEIKSYFYETILKIDPIQAVLQQELILWVAVLIAKDPSLFKCISIIRMGWLIEAMKLELEYRKKPTHQLCSMSPFEVKQLLEEVLRLSENKEFEIVSDDIEPRSPLFFRQLDGCLSRAPENFYKCVYQILENSVSGIIICGQLLSPNPVLQDMTATDLNFVTLIESYLDRISEPVYHSLVIEAFMVIAVILERNEELYFNEVLDINAVIDEAICQFKKANEFASVACKNGKGDRDIWQKFYMTPSNIRQGTTSYLAKAALDRLLAGDMNLNNINRDACLIS